MESNTSTRDEPPSIDHFWQNGNILPIAEAKVPILSHGFSRGSAIFDVFGLHTGAAGLLAFRADEHIKRLYRSAELLGMTIDYSAAQLMDGLKTLLQHTRLNRGIVKIMAYWPQEAAIDLVLEQPLDVSIFVIPSSANLVLDGLTPVTACCCTWHKLHPQTVPIAAKACAYYLNGYLSRMEAKARGFDIGVLLDGQDELAEGATESVFVVQNGVLQVPPGAGVLDSISRRTVLDLARELGIPVEETPLPQQMLSTVDEMFVSSSGSKVRPVSRYENRRFDAPGEVTQRLIDAVQLLLSETDRRYPQWFTPLRPA